MEREKIIDPDVFKCSLPVMALFCVFCSCRQPAAVLRESRSTEYIQRLVPVVLPVERASAQAALECSKEGMVLLSRLNVETSKNARLTLLLDSLGNLSVDATVERDTVYVPSDSVVTTVVETVVEYRDRALTRWERVKQEVGGWALGAGIFSVVAFVVWLVFKLK